MTSGMAGQVPALKGSERAHDAPRGLGSSRARFPAAENPPQFLESWRLRRRVSLNAFNGFAIGLTGPLIAYWLSLRFGVGPRLVAPAMAASFAFTAVSAPATGRFSQRMGPEGAFATRESRTPAQCDR